jgi:hypothetical protein
LSVNKQESRVDALIRITGLIFVALGGYLGYITYLEAGNGDLVPQIVPVFYMVAALILFAGLVAIIAKYK